MQQNFTEEKKDVIRKAYLLSADRNKKGLDNLQLNDLTSV